MNYLHGQTYDRRPVLHRQEVNERINLALFLLICFAIGCGLATLAGA